MGIQKVLSKGVQLNFDRFLRFQLPLKVGHHQLDSEKSFKCRDANHSDFCGILPIFKGQFPHYILERQILKWYKIK